MIMQKAIFDDLAWQHELYVRGGLQGLRDVYDGRPDLMQGADPGDLMVAGVPSGSIMTAWENIASGSPFRIEQGNKTLILREQNPVLQPYCDQLMDKAPNWMWITSEVGQSPIPSDGKFTPDAFRAMTSNGTCAKGPKSYHGEGCHLMNVGWWEDRQRWVFYSLLPDYQYMIRSASEILRGEVERPIADRAEEFRRNAKWTVRAFAGGARDLLPFDQEWGSYDFRYLPCEFDWSQCEVEQRPNRNTA